MEIWDAINDTLSVVVWPGVAVIAVVVLRGPIGTTRMFQGPAQPVVKWTGDNVPEINHGSSAHRADFSYDPDARWYLSKPGRS